MQNQELFEPGEYLDRQGPGYFSLLSKPGGSARQQSYELKLLPRVVECVDPEVDTWITQATFNTPNRRAVNLQSVGLLFADLDTYQNPNLVSRTPEEQAGMLVCFCAGEDIPAPSIVLFSGRGLQAKWLLTSALGPGSLFEWNGAQMALVSILEPFCADKAARDVSRVLRLDRTVNTKSGEKTRVVYIHGTENCPARYDFQELREELTARFPTIQPERPQTQKSRGISNLPREMSLQRLNWFRLYDIRDLWRLRGGVPEGRRELTLFWELNFLLRAEPGRASDLWKEAESLAAQIDPEWFRKEVQRATLSTLYRKAQEARAGVTVEYAGRAYPPLYTPKNPTLIDLFNITPDEERGLRTIISRTERNRRRTEKRRAEGAKPRTEYEAMSVSRMEPWKKEGISRSWWYRTREE